MKTKINRVLGRNIILSIIVCLILASSAFAQVGRTTDPNDGSAKMSKGIAEAAIKGISINAITSEYPSGTTNMCISCHNDTTYPEDTDGNGIAAPYKRPHNNSVWCEYCHGSNPHSVKYIQPNGSLGTSRETAATCIDCHQTGTVPANNSNFSSAYVMGNELHHSNDPNNGSLWTRGSEDPFWTNQSTACLYCHGETKHNVTALGKPSGFNGSNTVRTWGTWCGSCHYNGNSQYTNMVGTMGIIPPEITGDTNYGNYVGHVPTYYNHNGIPNFLDTACTGCHGSKPNVSAMMHDTSSGQGGPNCVSCHDVNANGAPFLVNVSAMDEGIHKDLNKDLVTSLDARNKKCWACHGDGDQPVQHPGSYKTPANCTDCHAGSNRNFTPDNTILTVSEHYLNGDQIRTPGASSCYKCHNKSEMMIFANDPDSGSGIIYGGANGGNNSTSHYGKKRGDLELIKDTKQYCDYCHIDTPPPDSFFDVFIDVYNTDIQNHSRYGTNPVCQDCHSTGRIHNATLNFSELTLPNSTICLECHGPGGSASIKDKSMHNNSVECSVCHLETSKDIHPVKYLNNTGGFSLNKEQGVKCIDCHETGLYTAPAIGKLQHSDNTYNGSLWNRTGESEFWDNNSLGTACGYCHGDTKHNTTALGRLNGIKGTNVVNEFGTWCGICHYQSNSQFGGMTGVFSGIGVPPEISSHVTYGNYPSGARDGGLYFDHSLSSYADSRCDDCHYSGEPPNLTKSVHNVIVGGSSCLGCHAGVDVDITKMGKHANVSKVDSGVTDDDCKGCHFNVSTLGQMVDEYANFSNTYYCQDCHTPTGRNRPQYDNITDATLRKDTLQHAKANCTLCHVVGNGYHPNGPNGNATGKNCYSCHYRTDGIGGSPDVADVGLNSAPFRAPGEDHTCKDGVGCHPGSSLLRPPLTGSNGCNKCHAPANNHSVTYGDHPGSAVTISSVTVDTPIPIGRIANVTGTISNKFVQVAKTQYRINNSADTVVIKDWTDMNATDGKFNGRAENVKGSIDTAVLPAGTYNVKVRGMISGYWAAGGSGHNAALPYYPDNGVWTSTVTVTMNVTGQAMYQVLASGQVYLGSSSWKTNFRVGSYGTRDANVNITFYNLGGALINSTSTTIIRNTSKNYEWKDYAPGVTDGTALINSTEPTSVITFQRMDTTGKLGFWEGTPLNTRGTEVFVSGLVYQPGRWKSGFKVLNTEDTTASVTMYFYNFSGSLVNTITRSIASKASPYFDYYTYGYNKTGGTVDGTVKVVSNKRAHVIASQFYESAGRLGFWEGIPLNSENTEVFISGLIYQSAGWRSGFKVANYNDTSASVTINFYNSSGIMVNTITRTIAPKSSPYFDYYTYGYNKTGGTPDGTATVISNKPVKVIESQFMDSEGTVDFYEARQISGNNTAYVLYQLYDSVERYGIKIANPGTVPISATIRFYDQNGGLVNTITRTIYAKTSPYYAWNTYAPGVTSGSIVVYASGRIVVVASLASEQTGRVGIYRGVDI